MQLTSSLLNIEIFEFKQEFIFGYLAHMFFVVGYKCLKMQIPIIKVVIIQILLIMKCRQLCTCKSAGQYFHQIVAKI